MAKRPGTPIATWLGGRRSRIASRAADGSRLQIKRLKSGDFAACTIVRKVKSCGVIPAGATVQDVRRLFRKATDRR